MFEPHFTPELIAPCGMNCGICKSYLAFSRGIPEKKVRYLIVQAVFPETKSVTLSGDTENFGEKKLNPVLNVIACPAEILIGWIGVLQKTLRYERG
jgi:hypothetical protein